MCAAAWPGLPCIAMCGIVGLYAKSAATRAQLGAHAGRMLVEMGDRGPDSAGIAVYRDPPAAGATKLSLHAARRRGGLGRARVAARRATCPCSRIG